jgi:hypothetical protein
MKIKYLVQLLIVVGLSLPSRAQDFEVTFDEDTEPVKKDAVFQQADTKMETETTLRYLIVEKARQYLGVGYHYGQSNENGFDCSGYVKYIYSSFGYDLPRSSYDQFDKSRHIKKRQVQPGDLVFFKISGRQISHVGIYIGDDLFIHAPSRGKKVTVDSMEADYYKRHFAGFGSILNEKSQQ